ncbi:MAG: GIY-YIG nuclease family protein [Bacteroidetes bacterium]|nr:GIY-YIG nuclease family protein [Bacteroidota bacterium]
MSCVYILFSLSLNKYYIGSTSDSLERRIHKHLTNHHGYTAKAKDWAIVYSEEALDNSAALKRESQIKKWKSRKMIEVLINSSSNQSK